MQTLALNGRCSKSGGSPASLASVGTSVGPGSVGGKSSCCSSPEKVRQGGEIVRDAGIIMLGGGRILERKWVSENGPEERKKKIPRETHVGVVDGDIGMQGLHICVLQSLYLELVLHVGPVYKYQQS